MAFENALLEAAAQPPLIFEPVPPPKDSAPEAVEAHLDALREALARLPRVVAVNVPQIVGGAYETVDALEYSEAIQKATGLDVIVNKIVALEPENALIDWHTGDRHHAGIRHVVHVGGESSAIDYPGPTVDRANEIARGLTPNPTTIGNICIPFRRRKDRDEPDRMVRKTRAGCDHFTSQIILEPVTMRRLLRDYDNACRLAGVEPAVVFIGLAPVTEKRDLRLLTNLGVEVPPHVERELLWDPDEMALRSLQLNLGVLRSILASLRAENIRVPVGLNVEQVSLHNWDASIELAREASLLLDEHAWLLEDHAVVEGAVRTATARHA